MSDSIVAHSVITIMAAKRVRAARRRLHGALPPSSSNVSVRARAFLFPD